MFLLGFAGHLSLKIGWIVIHIAHRCFSVREGTAVGGAFVS